MTSTPDPAEIDLTFVPRFRDAVAAIPVEDEGILYEEDTGTLHQLNPTATLVCSFVDGQTSVRTTVDELAAAFGVDPGRVADDVLAMVRDLADKGVLVTADAKDDPGGAA